MKTHVFLILLGAIHVIFCNQNFNITEYDFTSSCPVRWFRRKRAIEYTRWRATQQTTNEFIVKVLDDDLTAKPVVAVNIQSATHGGDKIIIGGVEVPPPITTTPEPLNDYTRFVPPTTIKVSQVDGDLYLAPVHSNNLTTNTMPKGIRNSERDDSPPASPQFLARTPDLLPRQYAPVASVAFNRRYSVAPVTPTSLSPYVGNAWDIAFKMSTLTRTPYPFELTKGNHNDDIKGLMYVTRTTHVTPERTSSFESELSSVLDVEGEIMIPTPTPLKYFEDNRRKEEIKKIVEKDSELSYNMLFYNEDEDVPLGATKEEESDEYNKKGNFKENINLRDLTDNELEDLSDDFYVDVNIRNASYKQDSFEKTDKEFHKRNGGIFGIPGSELSSLNSFKDREKRGQTCSLLKLRPLNFNSPRTLPEIIVQMRQWAENSPLAKWVDITIGNYTIMENPIYMMIVDDPSSGQILSAKQTVLIIAGIQGRDHQAVASAMYLLYQLIEKSESNADLLTKYRFWVIPVFNPDGYDYSMTFPHRRQWKKNLRQYWDLCQGRESCKNCDEYGIRCTVQPCYGVNLDRNFEYQWIPAEELRAEHPCGALYAGKRQLSEAETRALTLYLHNQRTPLTTFIALKEGDILRQRASRAAAAAYSISSSPYVAGQTSEFLSLYAGGIEDWMDGHLGIDNTYTIMVFGSRDIHNSKLTTERVVHESYAAVETLLLQSLEPLSPPPLVTLTKGKSRSSRNFLERPTVITFMFVLWNV